MYLEEFSKFEVQKRKLDVEIMKQLMKIKDLSKKSLNQ